MTEAQVEKLRAGLRFEAECGIEDLLKCVQGKCGDAGCVPPKPGEMWTLLLEMDPKLVGRVGAA